MFLADLIKYLPVTKKLLNVPPAGAGSGDMLKSVYDPALKGEQVLTISDITEM